MVPYPDQPPPNGTKDEELEKLSWARSFLLTYMNLEEGVLQVMYAMQAFEEYLLRGALEYYLFPGMSYDYFQNARLRANLSVMGVLNSITSLRDQFPKFAGLTGEVDARTSFLQKWNELSDGSVAFRFGERLRNYAQHQNQPVSGATSGGGWDEHRTLMETHLTVYCTVTDVATDRRISAASRKQFEDALGSRADVALILREMISGVGELIKHARSILEPHYAAAILAYESTLKIVDGYSDSDLRTALVIFQGGEFHVFGDFLKRAKSLHITHVTENAHSHFVSNKARGHFSQEK